MTSTPASRSARATTFAPRSWPSRPGLAMITRMLLMNPPTRCHVLPTYRADAISVAPHAATDRAAVPNITASAAGTPRQRRPLAGVAGVRSGCDGRPSQRQGQRGQVPVELVSVGVVARIDLRQDQPGAGRIGQQDAQAPGRVVEPDAGAVVRDSCRAAGRQSRRRRRRSARRSDRRPRAPRARAGPSASGSAASSGPSVKLTFLAVEERAARLGLLARVAAQHRQPGPLEQRWLPRQAR